MRTRTLCFVALLAIGATACSSSEPVAVTIRLFQFSPNPATVKAGGDVTWTNRDDVAHTITSGVPGSPTGTFDSMNVANGGSFTFTFASPGTFSYFCKNHNTMRGTIRVT